MGEGRGSVRTAKGQRCPAVSPLKSVMMKRQAIMLVRDISYSSGFQAVIGRTVTPALAPWPSILGYALRRNYIYIPP
eukprot:scaffold1245_cov122-Isochrysis_galbana.AAC.2